MTENEVEPGTMGVPEFAEVMGIGLRLAYEQARADALPVPVIKIGRRLMVSRSAVTRLLAGEPVGRA